MIIVVGGGGGGTAFAYISVTYPTGSICTCASGQKTLRAKDTSGRYVFAVPAAGTWIVSCTDGTNTATSSVVIASQYDTVTVALSFRVPAEYQEVEYLEASGTQYVNTGIAGNSVSATATVEARAMWTANNSGLIGASNSSNSNSALTVRSSSNAQFLIYQGGNYYTGGSVITNTVYDLIATFAVSGTSSLYANNTLVASGNTSGTATTRPLYIFATNGNGTANLKMSGRIYYLKITIDGTLALDLVPCYRKSDSVAGFWDAVSETFLLNAGTGMFAVGGNV